MIILGHRTEKMTGIVAKLAALGFFLKQFYFSDAGTLQIGDLVLLAAAGLCVLSCGVRFEKSDAPLYVFILAACVINGIYSLLYRQFIEESLYLVFNGLLIAFLFRPIAREEEFQRAMQFALRAAILLQLILYLANAGRWHSPWRYMGTFTDPNQFGFYIFTAFLGQHLVGAIQGKKLNWFWLALTIWEVVICGSSGMLVGLLVFLALYFLLGNEATGFSSGRFVLCMVFAAVIVLGLTFSKEIISHLSRSGIYLFQKTEVRLNTARGLLGEFLTDRGLTRVLEHPRYFLFGSGEGLWERFPISGWPNPNIEIHSTVVTLAFSYGVLPYAVLLIWVARNLKNLNRGLICIYAGLIVEACTLVNHRQPIFWLFFVWAGCEAAKRKGEYGAAVCGNSLLQFGKVHTEKSAHAD